jgi:TonB-linked SusC/RagA family outer membrane protein
VAKIVKYFHLRKFFCTLILSFLAFLLVFAQTGSIAEIKGIVLDEARGTPLPGASITLSDQKTGTVSAEDGSFSIRIKSFPASISTSFLGYQTAKQTVRQADALLQIRLKEDAELLDEIVVVGYGTQRRKELTGAVSTVSQSVLEQQALSFDALLSGAVAGLNVTQSSGQPGAVSSIRIRGGNSINAANEPLYVIDGIIVYPRSTNTGAGDKEISIESSINPLASINPADIESVSVLKDVSATAIFGSRGANGVIIITTKKGNRGKTMINYTATASWSTPAKRLDLMNAHDWANLQINYFGNKGNITQEQLAQIGSGYDWQDAVLRNGFSHNHELSVSGGDEKTKFIVSGNFVNQNGIIINSGFKRYNAHLSIDRDLLQNLMMGASVSFGKSSQNSLTTTKEVNYNSSPFGDGITNSLTYALFMPPTVPIYNENGEFNYQNPWESSHFSLNGRQANPVSDLQNSVAESINNSILANFYAQYSIFNGLIAKATLSTDQSEITQNFFAPSTSALGLNETGVGSIGKKQHEIWQSDLTFDYSKRFNGTHFINLLGGYTYQNVHENYLINRSSRFINETLKHNNLGDGEIQSKTKNGVFDSQIHSAITRLNYTLLERYNLTATFRTDYSDRFAKGKRWGYFPSVGLSWNIENEAFFKRAKTILPLLKLRFSAGAVGNTEIGDYLYAQIFKAESYNGHTVYTMDNLGNSNLTWETTTQYNAGIDAGLLGDRFNFTLDAYYKNTSDLLLEKPAPLGSGVDKQMVNIGNVSNKGLELGINGILISHKNLNWNVSANIARNINRVTHLGEDNNILSGQYNERILRTGEAFGSFYGLRFAGIVQVGEDVSKLPTVNGATPKPGDAKFVDVVKDGDINLNDRIVLGNVHPNFTYGLSSSLTYRDFDLFLSFHGSQGNEVINSLRRNLERGTSSYNVSAALLNAWTQANPSNEIQHVSDGYQFKFIDSRHVEDGSYFRFKNITLGYKLRITNYELRIFASAQNLFTITKYKGYDPEVADGIDVGAYPTARTFSTGISMTFH